MYGSVSEKTLSTEVHVLKNVTHCLCQRFLFKLPDFNLTFFFVLFKIYIFLKKMINNQRVLLLKVCCLVLLYQIRFSGRF